MSNPTLFVACAILLATAPAARAFNFTYNTSGNVQHWSFSPPDPAISTNVFNTNTHAIRFFIASDGYSVTNTANELNAVRNSFGQWQAISNTLVKFEDAGLVAPGYDVNTSDNTNVVYWAKTSTIVNGGHSSISGALAVTFKTFTVGANAIQQFDIVINGVEQGWFTDFNDRSNPNYFVESTLGHEIGHALGLSHASIGGATLLYAGITGVDTQAGLSTDEIAFAHALYPTAGSLSSLGNLKGTITKNGSPVLGAAIVLEDSKGNLACGTVSLTNGTYTMNAVPPGNYNARVVPLDPGNASAWLIRPQDIDNTGRFSGADTSFLPYPNTPVTLTAGATNTLNFALTNSPQAFRITYIRTPTTNPNSFSIAASPVWVTPGQSNLTIEVFSADLPTNNANFSISGDGLTIGAPVYHPGNVFVGLNGIAASLKVASNATPGLRTFSVTQGTNVAYANGFIEVLPVIPDYNFDGLDDTFQRKYFFPFTQINAAPNADPDQDGMDNYAEYVAGTVPTNAASFLKLQSTTTTSTGTTVAWQSVVGKRYQLFSNTNVVGASWQSVGGIYTATNTAAQLLDPSATNGFRFYRVQVFP